MPFAVLLFAREAAAAAAAAAAATVAAGEYCPIIPAAPTLCMPVSAAEFNVRLPFVV